MFSYGESGRGAGGARGRDSRLTDVLRPLLLDVGEYWRVLLPGRRLPGYQLRPGWGYCPGAPAIGPVRCGGAR
jgi:hypothetical protein